MYAESITGRDATGPLGMGWSTSWQTSASIASDGTVTISEPGGEQRVFQPDSRRAGYLFLRTRRHRHTHGRRVRGLLADQSDGTVTDYDSERPFSNYNARYRWQPHHGGILRGASSPA